MAPKCLKLSTIMISRTKPDLDGVLCTSSSSVVTQFIMHCRKKEVCEGREKYVTYDQYLKGDGVNIHVFQPGELFIKSDL